MMQVLTLSAVIVLFLTQFRIASAVTCASNPCNLVNGLYEPSTGYCCYNVPPADSLCTCPNNVQPVVNGPCRIVTPNQVTCNRPCLNGGVCNTVNGQQSCRCPVGFYGTNCEIQGVASRCYPGLCQAGTCYEQIVAGNIYAYCQCIPGWRGVTCNQCYFSCPRQGIFPDTAQCTLGRYFSCSQAAATPMTALCPNGQRFNRLTNQCDSTYQCT